MSVTTHNRELHVNTSKIHGDDTATFGVRTEENCPLLRGGGNLGMTPCRELASAAYFTDAADR
jgi:hypothetical protein